MNDIIKLQGNTPETLRRCLDRLPKPCASGGSVGIKLHWGERGNHSFLHPHYAREIVRWLRDAGMRPFVFDTTVLYSGGRRTAADSLKTAAAHDFTEEYLGCPVLIGDGSDGRDVLDIPGGGKYFPTVQAAAIIDKTDGFVLFSHFKGHIESGFGGAIKNLSMGLASRAQKQRMHADAHPQLNAGKCTRCGLCAEVCPTGAAVLPADGEPTYDLKTCVGCSQCIALCPQMALKIIWKTDFGAFQERLVETAAAIWNVIGKRTIVVNALLNITSECDCMPGTHPVIAADYGFIAGMHPLTVDEASIAQTGAGPFDRAHEGLPWARQFTYAREIGFQP
ncbi:MAG: DUF362 domain-containing protein [Deltaproteobacteria bacterium]|nr:DUF362 domain-containing protein [Deltaproteobacteria bacterium]